MKTNKHNLNCTCHDCGGKGMSMVDQRKMWDGKGSRRISAPDRPIDKENVQRAEAWQYFNKQVVVFPN